MVRWDCKMGLLGCMRERLDCRMVRLGCMRDLLESSLGWLVSKMEMLGCTVGWMVIHRTGCWGCSSDCWGSAMMATWGHTEVSWESRMDSLLRELVMGCMVTWPGSQESRAVETKLG